MNPYALPSWYTSPGTPRPAHLPHPGGMGLARPCGPDGQAGTVFPGPYDLARQDHWRPVAPGIWIDAGDSTPQACRRLDLLPRVTRWHSVPGICPEHAWLVPVLLRPADPAQPQAGLVSALDRVWRGGESFDAADLAPYQRALQALMGQTVTDLAEISRRALALVLDLIELTHHLTRADLAALGWLSEATLIRYAYALADCDHAAAEAGHEAEHD